MLSVLVVIYHTKNYPKQETVTDGFQKLLSLFIPVYDAISERSVAAKHWHADETGWRVKVLIDHFGSEHEGGTLNVDR
jgi:hypothetical protein